jgi:small multidrug resistance pump
MTWQNGLFLLAAITAEIIGTTALRLSEGFTRLLPGAIVLLGYGASFYLLSQGLKRGLPLGLSYAIWAGLGTVGIVIIGLMFFQEKLNLGSGLGVLLVVAGVVFINLFSNAH